MLCVCGYCTPPPPAAPAAAPAPAAPEFSRHLISQEPYVRSDIARCLKNCLDEPDSMVPITLGSGVPLVVKIGTKKII